MIRRRRRRIKSFFPMPKQKREHEASLPQLEKKKRVGRPQSKRAISPTKAEHHNDEKRTKTTSKQLEDELERLRIAFDSCKGPENILKSKTLQKRIQTLQQKIHDLKNTSSTPAPLPSFESTLSNDVKSVKKIIVPITRLYPVKTNHRNLFDSMSSKEAEKYKLHRAQQKRYAVMHGKDPPTARFNHIDMCVRCGIDRVVDKEMAVAVCPKCGSTNKFASHIFEIKESEKEDNATKQQSLNHMQKFSAQFERGHPSAPLSVLESLSIAYSKVHLHDPSKVQSCRTGTLLKPMRDIPKLFKRVPERLTKELKREAIPEYTSSQISQLLNQRNRLRAPDEVEEQYEDQDKKHKKSFSNQIYMRQLGRANRMEQSRLFPHAKTTKIHQERTRGLEKELELQREKLGSQDEMCWHLYPAS